MLLILLIYVFSKGDAMSTSEMRQAVTEYVKTNNLQKESDRQCVYLTILFLPHLTSPYTVVTIVRGIWILWSCLLSDIAAQWVDDSQ